MLEAGMEPVKSTPHDLMMARIMKDLTVSGHGEIHLQQVNEWMSEIRKIPYKYSLQWKTAQEVLEMGEADCKGKAVMLYSRLKAAGAKDVRLIIGKRKYTSRIQHAWVLLEIRGKTYMLDPTFFKSAREIESLDQRSYIPIYGYAGKRKFLFS